MARSDLLLALFKSYNAGDDENFRRTAEAIIAEEYSKKHVVLADRLKNAFTANSKNSRRSPRMKSEFSNKEDNSLVYDFHPSRPLSDIILYPNAASEIEYLIEEQFRSDILHAYNLSPRHRVLLTGPPGTGKTSLAEAIAYELAVPFYVVRYDSLIGSYLGETGSRLRNLFEQIRMERCVLFFDEFDSVGKERGDTHETGEIKRVVSTLLMQVDRLPDHVVVICASNHPELLDRAVWRRFQIRLRLPKPNRRQIEQYLKMSTNRFQFSQEIPLKRIAQHTAGSNFSEIEELLLEIKRRIVLEAPKTGLTSIVNSCLKRWHEKNAPLAEAINSDGNEPSNSSLTEKGSSE